MPGKVLIVIPCYNEEASLPSLLPELLSTALPNGYQLAALIVNDCSKDNTSAVAKRGQFRHCCRPADKFRYRRCGTNRHFICPR